MIGVPGMEADLLKMIQGIRILCVNEQPDAAYHALCENPLTLELLIKIIGKSNPNKTEVLMNITS